MNPAKLFIQMTGNDVVLDTNIIIDLFKGDSIILHFLDESKKVYVPYVVLGELLLGAYRSSHTKKHLAEIKGFLKKCHIIHADAHTANKYALIKASLLNKGKPIPENDIWIAAIAVQHNMCLITRDAHFQEISGLKIKNWRSVTP